MKSKESTKVLRGDTVWIKDYGNKTKESGFVCETISSELVYKGKS